MPRSTHRTLGLAIPVTDVLDPEKWRQRYAWGIPLGGSGHAGARSAVTRAREQILAGRSAGDAGASLRRLVDELPDDVIRWHLRTALSELELKLGVPFGISVCKSIPVDDGLQLGVHYDRAVDRLPYTVSDALDWYRIRLPPGVISVERVRGYYFDTLIWEISAEQDNLELLSTQWRRQGAINILPTNLQSILIPRNSGLYGVWATLYMNQSPIPAFWGVDYTVGPVTNDGQVGKIEVALANWVYAAAGILLLSMAGLAASKGLSSTSISMDGVSRSVGLQASAIYGLNSALEHVFDEVTKRIDWKSIRSNKRGIRILPYGF